MALICTAACTGICGACVVVWYLCVACVLCIAVCGGIAGALCGVIAIYGIAPGCAWLCCQI